MFSRVVLLLLTIATAPACLVVTMHPAYDEQSLAWNDALPGTWQSTDDETVITVARDEWRSYRIEYRHPIETGALTGYLTTVGDALLMDVMPARGQDRGAFVLPVHAVLRIAVTGDELQVTPLSYDTLLDRARKRLTIPGLAFVLDQKQNLVITSPTAELRRWLARPAAQQWLGGTTTFTRLKAAS